MSFYIFVNSDSYDLSDKRVRSSKIASYRLNNKAYLLYHRARLIDFLKANDFFVFYLADNPITKTKRFIPHGNIKEIAVDKSYYEDDIHQSRPIERVEELKSIVPNKSASIYNVKDRISFAA
jgi:hypothetical protein